MEVAVEWGPKSICPHSKEALNVARKPNPSVFCAWNALQIVGSSVLQNRLNLQESNKFEWPGSKETNRTNLLGLWILNISEPFWLRHIFARHLCSFPVEASREGEVPNHATQLWKINSLHSDRLDSQLKATTARSPTVLKPNVLKHLEDATTFYQGVT